MVSVWRCSTHTVSHIQTLAIHSLNRVSNALSRSFYFLHKYFESNTFLSGFYQFKPDWGWRQSDEEWVMREANAQCFVGNNIVVVFVCSWLATNSFPATITVTVAYARMQHTHTDSVYQLYYSTSILVYYCSLVIALLLALPFFVCAHWLKGIIYMLGSITAATYCAAIWHSQRCIATWGWFTNKLLFFNRKWINRFMIIITALHLFYFNIYHILIFIYFFAEMAPAWFHWLFRLKIKSLVSAKCWPMNLVRPPISSHVWIAFPSWAQSRRCSTDLNYTLKVSNIINITLHH